MCAAALLGTLMVGQIQPTCNFFFTDSTGDTLAWILSTDGVGATFSVEVTRRPSGDYVYTYGFRSDSQSTQNVATFRVVVAGWDTTRDTFIVVDSMKGPYGWGGSTTDPSGKTFTPGPSQKRSPGGPTGKSGNVLRAAVPGRSRLHLRFLPLAFPIRKENALPYDHKLTGMLFMSRKIHRSMEISGCFWQSRYRRMPGGGLIRSLRASAHPGEPAHSPVWPV